MSQEIRYPLVAMERDDHHEEERRFRNHKGSNGNNMTPNKFPNYASDAPNAVNKWQSSSGQDTMSYTNNPHALGRGVMQIDVQMAAGIKGDWVKGFGNASPYVVVKYDYDKKELRSSTHRGGGSTPVWNERFYYNIPNSPTKPTLLHIEIHNHHDTRKDNLLGRVSLDNLHEFLYNKYQQEGTSFSWLPIFTSSKGKIAEHRGDILVRFFFEKKDERYFGDCQYAKDHVQKFFEGSRKSVDTTHQGDWLNFEILQDNPVPKLAGTVIKLL